MTIENTAAADDLTATGAPGFTHVITVQVDSPTAKFVIAGGANVGCYQPSRR